MPSIRWSTSSRVDGDWRPFEPSDPLTPSFSLSYCRPPPPPSRMKRWLQFGWYSRMVVLMSLRLQIATVNHDVGLTLWFFIASVVKWGITFSIWKLVGIIILKRNSFSYMHNVEEKGLVVRWKRLRIHFFLSCIAWQWTLSWGIAVVSVMAAWSLSM